jgi:hypothetical protein
METITNLLSLQTISNLMTSLVETCIALVSQIYVLTSLEASSVMS